MSRAGARGQAPSCRNAGVSAHAVQLSYFKKGTLRPVDAGIDHKQMLLRGQSTRRTIK
jgi:hypothetical protein